MSDEEDEERWEREDAERKQRKFAAAIVAFREQHFCGRVCVGLWDGRHERAHGVE